MASLNISGWSNDNDSKSMNDSAQVATDNATKYAFAPQYMSIGLVALALPGNLFVSVVYVRDMTTSTKVYLFALAVADLTACVGQIVLRACPLDYAETIVVFFLNAIAIDFSLHLLAFVSIERLLAVYWPHLFNLSATRAKIALSTIAVITFFGATFMTVSQMLSHKQLYKMFAMHMILLSVIVMMVCYTLIAGKLLFDANASRKKVAAQNSRHTQHPVAGPSTDAATTVGTTTAKTTRAFKSVPLLFIVTVVFIACWMPVCLAYIGVPIPDEMRSLFVINFVANPFIYSAASPMFRKDARQFCSNVMSTLRTRPM